MRRVLRFRFRNLSDPNHASVWNHPLAGYVHNEMRTILIPGTNWQASGGWGPENSLFEYGNQLPTEVSAKSSTQLLEWPGGNSDRGRIAGAKMLIETVAACEFALGEKLNIIAHSHGGNVALAASHLGLSHPIDTLITLNKPTRLGQDYMPVSNIGSFYNISAEGDRVQWFASDAKLQRRWSTDTHAANLAVNTASSDLKPHAALIWDDKIREIWWNWFLQQESYRATSSTKGE
jgi:hypothetical protein